MGRYGQFGAHQPYLLHPSTYHLPNYRLFAGHAGIATHPLDASLDEVIHMRNDHKGLDVSAPQTFSALSSRNVLRLSAFGDVQ